MKFRAILVIFSLLSLLSCKKEETKYCFQCSGYSINGPNQNGSLTTIICNMTQTQIDDSVKADYARGYNLSCTRQ